MRFKCAGQSKKHMQFLFLLAYGTLICCQWIREETWRARWNISCSLCAYLVYPSGKKPQKTFRKGEVKLKVGQDQSFVYYI